MASPKRPQRGPLTTLVSSLVGVGLFVACASCAKASPLPGQVTEPASVSPTASTAPTAAESSAAPSKGVTSAPASVPETTVAVPPAASEATRATTAVILVTYGTTSDSVYASGLVTGVSQGAGTCRLSATSGADQRSGTIDAAPSASAMNCGRISIAVPAGDWTLTLTYTSGVTSRTSDPVTVHRS